MKIPARFEAIKKHRDRCMDMTAMLKAAGKNPPAMPQWDTRAPLPVQELNVLTHLGKLEDLQAGAVRPVIAAMAAPKPGGNPLLESLAAMPIPEQVAQLKQLKELAEDLNLDLQAARKNPPAVPALSNRKPLHVMRSEMAAYFATLEDLRPGTLKAVMAAIAAAPKAAQPKSAPPPPPKSAPTAAAPKADNREVTPINWRKHQGTSMEMLKNDRRRAEEMHAFLEGLNCNPPPLPPFNSTLTFSTLNSTTGVHLAALEKMKAEILAGPPAAKLDATATVLPYRRALDLLNQYRAIGTKSDRESFARQHRAELKAGPLSKHSILNFMLCGVEIHGAALVQFALAVKQLETAKPLSPAR
jgi:hypothetical protein